MRTKLFHTNSTSKFATRFEDNSDKNKMIADIVINKILCPPGQDVADTLFLSDGSSTSYVFDAFLKAIESREITQDFQIYTNNPDVLFQSYIEDPYANLPFDKRNLNVEIPSGAFFNEYFSIMGQDTTKWVERVAHRSICILAVTGLDWRFGPYAANRFSRAIKKAVMANADLLVVLVDDKKLSKKRNRAKTVDHALWSKWRNEAQDLGKLWVVTNSTVRAEDPFEIHKFESFPDDRESDEILKDNCYMLRKYLGDQFILTEK
ncbi:MAG: hypothetical protein IID32_09935, partial [Planctomycetes bacterium]|nr:hypothetical protein [Planctomycetota bacterium]